MDDITMEIIDFVADLTMFLGALGVLGIAVSIMHSIMNAYQGLV